MSETPQGPSWFQATDGKWYPPPDGQQPYQGGDRIPPVSEQRARKRYPIVLGFAVPILILSVVAGFLVARSLDDDDESVVAVDAAPGEIFLEPAAEVGPDPFAPTPFAPPPDPVLAKAVVDTPVRIAPDASVTVKANGGAQVGLYGGTRQNAVCDARQMTEYLVANPDKAAAWVAAQNADPSLRFEAGALTVADIPAYIESLTPLVLLQDTRVTMSGFENGRPTPHQSVLQKGGAVLVDKYGVPRAKCYCGNPLTAPEPSEVAPVYVGRAWPDFEPALVAVVTPSPDPIAIFVIIDIDSGETYSVSAGNDATPVETPPTSVAETTVPATSVAPETTAVPTTSPDTTAPPTTAPPTTAPPTAPPQPAEPAPIVEQDCTPTGDQAAADIAIVNNFSEPVQIVWHTFDCGAELFQTLGPGESATQGSFEGHRWTAARYDGSTVMNFEVPTGGGAVTWTIG